MSELPGFPTPQMPDGWYCGPEAVDILARCLKTSDNPAGIAFGIPIYTRKHMPKNEAWIYQDGARVGRIEFVDAPAPEGEQPEDAT